MRGREETRAFKGNWGESLWFIGGSSSEVRDGKLLNRCAYRHAIRNRKKLHGNVKTFALSEITYNENRKYDLDYFFSKLHCIVNRARK